MGRTESTMENMEIDPSVWCNKSVLVTGHTGFKGGWLALWLHSMGAKVTGYSLSPPSDPNLFEICDLKNHVNSIHGDVCDLGHINKVLKETRPDVIFHMAAQSLVRESYKDPVNTMSTNIMGTINILDAIRNSKNDHVLINVTSDKCYENTGIGKEYTEEDRLGGFDPYSSSKACAEIVTAAYVSSFFLDNNSHKKIASVRAGNVIGGGDWGESRLIPDIIRALTNNATLQIRNPAYTRPWQHVLDALNGYILLAEQLLKGKGEYTGAWNFGPEAENSKPVSWVVDIALSMWDGEGNWQLDKEDHPHEAEQLSLDASKARTRLNWKPKLSLDNTLEWSINWYKAWNEKKDMYRLTLSQINEFQNKTGI